MPKSPKPNRRPAARSRASAQDHPFTPAETRARHDGWTRERQTGFIQALAESGCVEEACAAVQMSRQSAYRLRARIDAQGFRVAWDKALDYAIRRLSDACFSRALHGEIRPIFFKGEQVGERVIHDNKLAMFMLRYRDPLRYSASLDQMVYSGHTESAAIDLNAAIHRVADEAEGLARFEPDRADPEPYATQPIAAFRADAEMEALIASDATVYGSHERRARIKAARIARDVRQSGYASEEAMIAARTAEREAREAAEVAAVRACSPPIPRRGGSRRPRTSTAIGCRKGGFRTGRAVTFVTFRGGRMPRTTLGGRDRSTEVRGPAAPGATARTRAHPLGPIVQTMTHGTIPIGT